MDEAFAEVDSVAAIDGMCDARLRRVHDAFAENFARHGEVGAAVAITVDGKPVVDLWAGHADAARTRRWTRDTIVNIASATKGLTASCAHRLVDRGLLDLEAPVATYWPEFAQAGKAAIPVHLLLSHRAGLPAIEAPLPTAALYDWDQMTRALAAQQPWWQPGTKHGYHAFTFGWLVGEVVRRITGRSLGRYWREEVAEPLGVDCHIGLAAEHDARVAEFIPIPPDEPDLEEALLQNAPPMVRKALNNPPKTVADMNTPAWRRAEIPAGNAHTNARALARVYGALACGGAVDGVRVLRLESIAQARSEQANGPDAVLFGWPTRFGLGFSLPPEGAGFGSSSATAFGCPGAGGSIGFADPDARVGFGYTMNQMHAAIPPDPRGPPDRGAVCVAVTGNVVPHAHSVDVADASTTEKLAAAPHASASDADESDITTQRRSPGSAPDASAPPDLVFVPFVGESGGGGAGCECLTFGAGGCGTTRLAVPVAGEWAVLEVVMNVPVDLAACVHPRFVHMDSGHCVPNRPL